MNTEAEFRASLECYRGPLDLLLYLIKKDEVDILDIPIGRITEQFLEYIQILSALDPNACGEFLVVAARLMEIKSRELLPVDLPDEEEEELEDPRLELVLQLLEYKKYKERALLLEHLVGEHQRRHRRPETDLDDLPEEPNVPLELGNVSMWDLVTAFQKVQLALNMRQPHRVLFEDRPIEDYVAAIESRLDRLIETSGEDSSLAFESLFDDCRDRYDAIGYFLAVLELAKQGTLLFTQEELFGPISIRRRVPPPEDDGMESQESDEAADTNASVDETSTEETLTDELSPDEKPPMPPQDAAGEPEDDLGSDPEPDTASQQQDDETSPAPGSNRISGFLSDTPSPSTSSDSNPPAPNA